jgi:hypothetical protein
MRRTITDTGNELEQILSEATRSLWRFEQQPHYAIDDEAGLFAGFRDGRLIDPNQAPGLRAWFEQVEQMTKRGIRVGRLRIVDDPATEYQRWLQYVDQWNRRAGETIDYLPRWAITGDGGRTGLEDPPFAGRDWWLIDREIAVIMHVDPAGVRTKIEVEDRGRELADAIQFGWRAERASIQLAELVARRPAA